MGNMVTAPTGSPSSVDETDGQVTAPLHCKIALEELVNYEYPFENLVFEGGGNKGIAYCGSLMVLEKLGILSNAKRFAGSSAGSIIAAFLSVDFSVDDIKGFLSEDIEGLLIDHKWGYFSLVPNLLRNYGWNPGHKIDDWFGKVFANKTQNADITFWEVYKKYGRVLCIVVTNVNHLAVEYCHPKTTPHMPIRLAIRMSMSIPIMFAPPRYAGTQGQERYYVDGGVLCNYPIHCFDGWWLSMDKDDTFLSRIRPLSNLLKLSDRSYRFDTFNEKTIGFVLYSEDEADIMRTYLEERLRENGCPMVSDYPKTSLSEMRKQKDDNKYKECAKHDEICSAFDKLIKLIDEHNPDNQRTIDLGLLSATLQDSDLTDNDQILLFGKVIQTQNDIRGIFNMLDSNQNNEIELQELINSIDSKGIDVQSQYLGYHGKEITGFQSFLSAVSCTLLTHTKRSFMKDGDKHRTVGINTGYIQTTDFALEDGDKEFLITEGWNGSVAFFKEYYAKNRDSLKSKGL